MNHSIKLLIASIGMLANQIFASDLGSYRLTQTIGTVQYESVFTKQAVAQNAIWSEGRPLPLSIDQAVALARQCVSDAGIGGPWSLSNVQFLSLSVEGSNSSNTWLYEVTFTKARLSGTSGKDQLIVPVSLGGNAAGFVPLK